MVSSTASSESVWLSFQLSGVNVNEGWVSGLLGLVMSRSFVEKDSGSSVSVTGFDGRLVSARPMRLL